MNQLSFFSADTVPPNVDDLGGLLAAQGQVVVAGGGARVSVVVDAQWRAEAIAELIAEAGLAVEVTRSEEGSPLVRTASVAVLAALAADWTKGAVKAVPAGWIPGPRALRAWTLAAGCAEGDGDRFVFGLDPHAPDTHPVLAQSLMRAGIAPTLMGTRGPRPGLRVVGHRRLSRLVENIGQPPDQSEARSAWPRV
ncbi:hypothetical protein [Rhodococcus kronopolitis]|uniref:Uncharacterized protein n=1 Tax=Rhodococcus kronopolitis TaxID=1460226 RepID=A0ABV9FZ59_9NOCA